MKRYGVPYQGSKNGIVEKIVSQFPEAENFYDLFAGGCAVTDYAMRSGKFKNFYVNDINPMPTQLFIDAIEGKFRDEKRWISRENFSRLKDSDPYIKFCWSFGNTGDGYLYSREIEPWKKALHYARVFKDNSLMHSFGITDNDFSRVSIKKNAECYKDKYIEWYIKNVLHLECEYNELKKDFEDKIKCEQENLRRYLVDAKQDAGLTSSFIDKYLGNQMSRHYFGKSQWQFPTMEVYERLQKIMPKLDKDYMEIYGFQALYDAIQRLERLERLESLERLQSLERLESFQNITRYNCSYDEVEIKPNSVIYCDIPYRNTEGYGEFGSSNFDYEKFYEWANRQTEIVFISEYSMPEV